MASFVPGVATCYGNAPGEAPAHGGPPCYGIAQRGDPRCAGRSRYRIARRFPLRPQLLLLAAALLLTATEARAQISLIEGPPPPEVQDEVFEFLNAPEVLRIVGGTRLPTGTRIEGDVAILGGLAEIEGEILGRLTVVNGDLRLLEGSIVRGDILVIGGTLTGGEIAPPQASAVIYTHPLNYRAQAGRIVPIPDRNLAPTALGTDLGFGYTRLTLRAGESYNRVEGLPVMAGPIFRTSGSNPLALDAFAIWRSVNGLTLGDGDLGYSFTLRQGIGGRGALSLGASAYNEVASIESQGFSNVETSLSTFLLHKDLRDFYEREGWSAFLEAHPSRIPIRASLTLREEEHGTPPIRSPWSLRGGERPWRPLPLSAEGRVRTVELGLTLNTTDDEYRPSDGWWGEVKILRQTNGELRIPPSLPDDPDFVGLGAPEDPDPMGTFMKGTIDLRRYARVGPTSRLLLRAFAGNSLNGDPLPPQMQMAIGGEGSLPAYRRFSGDCGARSSARIAPVGEGEDPRQRVYPSYGCDGVLLFQAELQNSFPFSWNPLPESWENSEASSFFEVQPIWALTFNAGRGWAHGEVGNGHLRTDAPTRADVGVGLFLGGLGLYWSYPLSDREEGVNFFVRLQRRF